MLYDYSSILFNHDIIIIALPISTIFIIITTFLDGYESILEMQFFHHLNTKQNGGSSERY